MRELLNYIDGKWTEALNGDGFDVINPATGEVIAKAAKGGREDARLAIAAAKRLEEIECGKKERSAFDCGLNA